MTIRFATLVAGIALSIAACSPAGAPVDDIADAPPAAVDGSADTSSGTPADAPVDDAPADAPGTVPAADDGAVVGFTGYRGAAFGSDIAAVRAAYPGELALTPPPETPDACTYLLPATTPGTGYPIAFMFEGGRFVRVDVATADVAAPGALAVGMSAAEVTAAFPGAESSPHKYVEGGQYLVVAPADGGDARLVFEIDPQGTITEWRIGLPPQVHYVEGCS